MRSSTATKFFLSSAHGLLPLICLILLPLMAFAATEVFEEEGGKQSNATSDTTDGGGEHHEEEAEPVYALLFPSFCLTLGVFVFFLLSRYLQALPFTAVMFLIGTAMGIGEALSKDDHQISESIRMWSNIDSEVLLLSFLPGLIFKDAYALNVHLFRVALGQCLNFAFPMVLAGTSLTALVAWGIFPYGWSFNLVGIVTLARWLRLSFCCTVVGRA